ncbi:hypothetical protein Noc_2192 [Nitrosococcus oceani ATCC 19707]|uniref:Uncharacterized protein n=2 Tax=Nitrosococcus oceani TaxID=1229 RepID=Q3J944_NITOC|nr:hypothetical protein [Nitrosococcus oceani]ABA58652.1 hypothetical protein Noc_2192 [Nitrosococcus oceani ATCC 19707]KFI18952.1 hypothetical protein IB75_11680 [Nitrosococcus oceani C-27]GEM19772.1 hypothetical protein NONS58_11680 [Nitrosococcus oceani]
MNELLNITRTQFTRQVGHWTMAASRLGELESLIAPSAWEGLEYYLGTAVRQRLREAVDQLLRQGDQLHAALNAAHDDDALDQVRRQLVDFRKRYLRTEITLDFYADAINIRTNPHLAALLRACDALAYRSMAQVLDPIGKPIPLVLTYVDKGLGASILKAGLRLWDQRTESPAAAIKIVYHNLYRPTALIHETGHQVAHIVGWNNELAAALEETFAEVSPEVAEMWAGWASEIAADAFAFAHTGYAAVAGLHDVLSGSDGFVFRHRLGDPHPISYIRVLLGIEMCRQFYGAGPWDDLVRVWTKAHSLKNARLSTGKLLQQSLPLLPKVVHIVLRTPMRAFRGRALGRLIDPSRVSPASLIQLERQLGPALYTSMHWIWTEALRLLALTGLQVATMPEQSAEILKKQEAWMLRLGASLKAA